MTETATLSISEGAGVVPAELAASERRLRLIFDEAPIGIMIADGSATLLEVNAMLCKILGYKAEELVGRRVHTISHPEDLALTERVRQRIVDGSQLEQYERRYIRKDGSAVCCAVKVTATRDDAGGLDRIFALVEEITDRKKAEERVAYQARLLDCVEQAVIATDLDGTIVYFNRYAEKLFGWKAEEAVGRKAAEITPSTMTREQAKSIMARLTEGEPWSGEFELMTRDGRSFPAHVSDSPVFDVHGKLIGVVGVSFEISDQKAAEASMRRRIVEQAAIGELGQLALTSREIETVAWRATMRVGEILAAQAVEICRGQSEHSKRIAIFDQRARESERTNVVAVNIPAADGSTWGRLIVHPQNNGTYDSEDAAFLRSIAVLIGQCAERVRSETELRTRELQQSAIAELGRRVLSRVDDVALGRACELVRAGLGVEFSVFMQVTGDGRSLVARTGTRWLAAPPQPVPIDASHAGYVVLTGEPVIVHDYAADPRFDTTRFVPAEIRAGVGVPVMSGGRTFGVLTAQTRQERTFAAADLHFMQALAMIIAEAMARDAAIDERDSAMHELQLLLESTAEGIYTMDAEGNCTLANRAAGELLGVPPDQLIGKRLHELMHHEHGDGRPYDFADCPVSDVLRNGVTRAVRDEVFWRADGTPMPVEFLASPLVDDGTIRGAVVTFTDITQQKQLAAQLERATRLSSLGRLAATMAHEFNNVLMAISPFAEILMRDDSDSARRASAARHISGAIQRAKRITSDILRFTRPAEPVLARIDVTGWLQGFAAEARSMLGAHALELHIRDASLAIKGDASQLHQALLNLVINARDAMADPGTISIAAGTEPSSVQFEFGVVEQPDRYVHIAVADTGCGIAPETLSHLFEPLYTTKRNGTGIGLTVAHQVITAHGGQIFVETAVGRGTTFHLFIPRDASVRRSAQAASAQPACRARNVLLVEDDRSVAAGVAALLEIEGITVQIVDTGAAVLPVLAENLPDAVLLDIGLPDMDGTAVFGLIAGLYPRLPVIFSSGHTDAARLENHLTRSNVGFLMKPWEMDSLLQLLNRVVA